MSANDLLFLLTFASLAFVIGCKLGFELGKQWVHDGRDRD